MTKVVNLNALLAEQGGIELDGAIHVVRPLKGREYQALQAMQREQRGDVDELYRIAGACVTTLTYDQVLDLTLPQVQAILAIAGGGIVEVEASAPKATATPTATPPA